MTTRKARISRPVDGLVRREFTVDPYQGAAAMFAGSTAEGLPLHSMTRKGNKVVCIYGKPNAEAQRPAVAGTLPPLVGLSDGGEA